MKGGGGAGAGTAGKRKASELDGKVGPGPSDGGWVIMGGDGY